MMGRPMLSFLLMYESHDMRHTGFPQVDGCQRDPQESGRHNFSDDLDIEGFLNWLTKVDMFFEYT